MKYFVIILVLISEINSQQNYHGSKSVEPEWKYGNSYTQGNNEYDGFKPGYSAIPYESTFEQQKRTMQEESDKERNTFLSIFFTVGGIITFISLATVLIPLVILCIVCMRQKERNREAVNVSRVFKKPERSENRNHYETFHSNGQFINIPIERQDSEYSEIMPYSITLPLPNIRNHVKDAARMENASRPIWLPPDIPEVPHQREPLELPPADTVVNLPLKHSRDVHDYPYDETYSHDETTTVDGKVYKKLRDSTSLSKMYEILREPTATTSSKAGDIKITDTKTHPEAIMSKKIDEEKQRQSAPDVESNNPANCSSDDKAVETQKQLSSTPRCIVEDSQRPPEPLPPEAFQEKETEATPKKYVHYDTPYEFRIFRLGVNTFLPSSTQPQSPSFGQRRRKLQAHVMKK